MTIQGPDVEAIKHLAAETRAIKAAGKWKEAEFLRLLECVRVSLRGYRYPIGFLFDGTDEDWLERARTFKHRADDRP